ncbi:hypothetical protein LJR219_004348 [Phenylobacterium sp. LjRoot219]|uniref:alpha-L-rhamnosidase-related protein n=1 Tax=Phenylobacterium sp. LjRoot219 TaxID=3342283 RepID=UPI003ECF6F1E
MSADNRFVLYVNGQRVAAGPSRGDLGHWRVQALDLAPHLRRGTNVIAAQVWNEGRVAPLAQISARTAFMVDPTSAEAAELATGAGWQVRLDDARKVSNGWLQLMRALGPEAYYVAGAAETHDGARRAWDWAAPKTSATDWIAAIDAISPQERPPWSLIEDALPQMAYQPAPGGVLVSSSGPERSRFPSGPLTIPPNSERVLMVDTGKLEAAYPVLTTSGGLGSQVTITYAEALYGPDKKRLADRAQVEGGRALGLSDTFQPDGGPRRRFETYWWRAWRFAEIRVKTGSEELTLESFTRQLTGYPFKSQARFHSSDPQLDRIWRIGWDTVRLNAHETYMDTAYWEQLQYVGDTRLMALITYAVNSDARLPEQAIQAIADSKSDGLPLSRWPSHEKQSIPPFALLWVGMLHDYWMYRPDPAVLKRNLPVMRDALGWYERYVDAEGLVGKTPGWEFIDWRPRLSNQPPGRTDSDDRCIITLMYVGALKQAADLERALGEESRADADARTAQQLTAAIRARCWSPERGLFSDGADKAFYSQHANVLAVLYDVAPKSAHAAIMDKITVRRRGIEPPAGITGTTYYFAFYLARALEHAGMSDRYLEVLQAWREMLAQNFTAWPETPDPSRSDSHAWSAHPTLDLLTLVAGVKPASAGFRTVRIEPHLGDLTDLDAAVAHPAGPIETRYARKGGRLRANIKLPPGLSGTFAWGGRSYPLHPGRNEITLRP